MDMTELTPQQRENLRSHLVRRIGRMDDAALLHFEQITRRSAAKPAAAVESKPESDPQSAANTEPQVERKLEAELQPAAALEPETQNSAPEDRPLPEAQDNSSEKPAAGLDQKAMNRRQAITYTVTGALALLAASTGIGWGRSLREGEKLREEGELLREQGEATREDFEAQLDTLLEKFASLRDDAFEASLRYTLNEMNAELDELQALTDALAVKRDASAQMIDQYQEEVLPKTQASIQELKEMTAWMRELGADPYMFEALDVLVNMLETKDLKSYFDFFKAYDLYIPALKGYLSNVPKFFAVNEKTVAALAPWLDEENGIDAQLLTPLEEEMFRAFDSASRQVRSVKNLSEGQLSPAIETFLEKRDQFYDALEES